MPKYNVTIYYSSSIDYEVEAADPDEAEDKAIEEHFARKLADTAEFEDITVFDEAWNVIQQS